MLTKLLLKLLPAFIPLLSYIFWVVIVEGVIVKYILKKINSKRNKSSKIIDGEFEVIGSKTTQKNNQNKSSKNQENQNLCENLRDRFTLKNNIFVFMIYLSLLTAIFSLIYHALNK